MWYGLPGVMVFTATFNNISVKSMRYVTIASCEDTLTTHKKSKSVFFRRIMLMYKEIPVTRNSSERGNTEHFGPTSCHNG